MKFRLYRPFAPVTLIIHISFKIVRSENLKRSLERSAHFRKGLRKFERTIFHRANRTWYDSFTD